MFVGWSTPGGSGCAQLACAGAPEQIRREAAASSLRILRDALQEVIAGDA